MIDEKKLLEELENFTLSVCGNANAMALTIIDECRKRFAQMVEEQPKVGEWIPCEKKMPEINRETNSTDCVLVTDGHCIWMAYWIPDKWIFADCTNSNTVIDWTEIIKWQPLPEIYKD